MAAMVETPGARRSAPFSLPPGAWRLALPIILLAILFAVMIKIHPRGFAVASMTPWANQAVTLAFVAVGQFFVVVTRGLDLSIGAILALYEHRTFVEGVLSGINSFDQWGVELGKSLAKPIVAALRDGAALPQGTDASTAALVAFARSAF